jgi:hypothetical protein
MGSGHFKALKEPMVIKMVLWKFQLFQKNLGYDPETP